MTDDIQMPIDVDTSELKEKLASFVDNLTRIDVAREANNDIIKDIKNMGIKNKEADIILDEAGELFMSSLDFGIIWLPFVPKVNVSKISEISISLLTIT